MELSGIEKRGKPDHKYTYNDGTEKESSFGLNWYETEFRRYDAQLGRFHGIDKLAETMIGINPYHYSFNNPIKMSDPSGLAPIDEDRINSNYKAEQPHYKDSLHRTALYLAGSSSGSSSQSPNIIIVKDKNGKTLMNIDDGKKEITEITLDIVAPPGAKAKEVSYETYSNPLIQAFGFGFDASFSVGMGANMGIEWVYFTAGPQTGQSKLYFKAGVNFGLEGGASVYGFMASFQGNPNNITFESWKGMFFGYNVGPLGFFWATDSKNPLYVFYPRPSKLTWHGVSGSSTLINFVPGEIPLIGSGKWSATHYSYMKSRKDAVTRKYMPLKYQKGSKPNGGNHY